MSIKEKVIKETMLRISKRLEEIQTLLDFDPLKRLIEIYKEVRTMLEENQGIEKRTSPEFNRKITELAKEEKKMKELAKIRFSETQKLIEEQVCLESEMTELENELYLIRLKQVKNERTNRG